MSPKKNTDHPQDTSNETPLMRQYNQVKAKYPGALILFRVGDFYETFGEDAIKVSKILNIALTKRSNGAAAEVELAGFPHHALDVYMPRLVKAGNRVAVCDQLEDPKLAKGIVKRGVTELVTPGLAYSDSILDRGNNNYLAALYMGRDHWGVAFLDISTGEFLVAQGALGYVQSLMQSFSPAEIVLSKNQEEEVFKDFAERCSTYSLEEWAFDHGYALEVLNDHFKTVTLKGFGVEKLELGVTAAGAVMRYLEDTEHKNLDHIRALSRLDEGNYVWLDGFTIQNLELVRAQREGGVSLLNILDKTKTPMGSRLLARWILFPLKEVLAIRRRLDAVDSLFQDAAVHTNIARIVKNIGDLERLASKVSIGRSSPREVAFLAKSLAQVGPLRLQLFFVGEKTLVELAEQLHDFSFLLKKITSTLVDAPPALTNQGNMIKPGVSEELDELRAIAHSGKDYLLKLQKAEIKKTGIGSLKVGYNKVFGYYLEVSNAHKGKVPAGWVRKQTLANAERYITEELKVYEEKIITAEERYVGIEQRLFQELVATVAEFVPQIQSTAQVVAQVDCFLAFAEQARQNNYCKPRIEESGVLDIKNGRHPVIEQFLEVTEDYVPNDTLLDSETQQVIIVTGPNMSGKSALLRQTALIVIMAQMGSFVPAESVTMGVVDKIFTRVGASDNIAKGESTFMTEMTETASIMNNLSSSSLILMDEIGRGTSTYDGISIAWSIVEYLHGHEKFRPKTLFATHYHELNEIASRLPRVKNFNIATRELEHEVLFLRKLQPGGTSHSFGINVAKMAGMPEGIIQRAREVLSYLEQDTVGEGAKNRVLNLPTNRYQISIADVEPEIAKLRQFLHSLDVDTLSPIEALLKLNELKKLKF